MRLAWNRLRRTVGDTVTSDGGYAAVMTALIIVPLMGFAGFAVDIGAWYSRAAALQRGADAAALAGVVWQPDFTKAEAEARAVATRNGLTDGVNDVTVTVSDVGSNQLFVEITDNSADMFFAGLFLNNVTITRHAIGEYADPIPLGSPANVMGFGTQSVGGEAPSYAWSAMMGHCTHSAYGDLISLLSTNDFGNNNGTCGDYANPYHRDTGYDWIVEIPATLAGTAVDINVWDWGACTNSDRPVNAAQSDHYDNPIRFTLYKPNGTISLDDDPTYAPNSSITDGTRMDTSTWTPSATGDSILGDGTFGCGAWTTLWTTDGTTGLWHIRTEIADSTGDQDYADVPGLDEGGVNYFSFWADSPASSSYCLTFNDPDCVGIYANKWMPVRTQPPSGSAPAIFYLAEIDPQHQDKTLLVSLWDPGEGMESMEILDPAGNAVPFTYRTVYAVKGAYAPVTNAQPCALSNYCLDVTNARWDGQLVEITVDLSTLPWSTYSNNWFRVRYKLISGQTSVDWTTWGVEVVGDPVRLLE